MVLSTRPNTNFYDMLEVVSSFFTDCEKFYHDARNQSVSCQQQLDEVNAKLLAQFEIQNAEILKLQDELEQNKIKSNFYRQQAAQADMIPPHRRRRTVHSVDNLALSPDQLYQQVLFDRDALAHRDAEIQRLQLQVLTVSADLAELRISTFEQHFDLVKEFDPEAELEEAVANEYVSPRRMGFYQWTASALERLDAALFKCRTEARAHASSATAAQKQCLTAQANLAQAQQQLREAQDRHSTVNKQLREAHEREATLTKQYREAHDPALQATNDCFPWTRRAAPPSTGRDAGPLPPGWRSTQSPHALSSQSAEDRAAILAAGRRSTLWPVLSSTTPPQPTPSPPAVVGSAPNVAASHSTSGFTRCLF